MKGKIFLVMFNNKVVPAVIIEILPNSSFRVAQLKPALKTDKGVVNIGHPFGLKSESSAILNKVITVTKGNFIKLISEIDDKLAEKIALQAREMERRKELHKSLQELKRKIILAQINNMNYKEMEKQVDAILIELGYPITHEPKINRKSYYSYRETPIKGRIKIYRGGKPG